MQIPKYIKDILSRSHFDTKMPFSEPGYTLAVNKRTKWTTAASLGEDTNKLCAWARREFAKIGVPQESLSEYVLIHEVPTETHKCNQFAYITIFDPVMKGIEELVGD